MGPFFQDQMGTFEVQCEAPRNCSLVQMAPTRPIEWSHGAESPLSVAGDPLWADTNASVTVQMPAGRLGRVATASVCARVGATGDGYNDGQAPPGYCLHVTSLGEWAVAAGRTMRQVNRTEYSHHTMPMQVLEEQRERPQARRWQAMQLPLG